MANLFDAEFEKYIVFHRGVAEVKLDEEGNLYVYYQDGEVQNLGNVIGAKTKEDVNAIVDYIEQFNTKKSEMQEVVENAESLTSSFEDIPGIEKDPATSKFYIAFDEVDGIQKTDGGYKVINSDEVSLQIDNSLESVDGITKDADGIFYVDSKDAKTYVNNIVKNTTGLGYDRTTGNYFVAFDAVSGIVLNAGKYSVDYSAILSSEQEVTMNLIKRIHGIKYTSESDIDTYSVDFSDFEEATEVDIENIFT